MNYWRLEKKGKKLPLEQKLKDKSYLRQNFILKILGKIGFEPMKNKFDGFTVHCFWPLSHFPECYPELVLWKKNTEKVGIEPTQPV
jgi:hypothetical protein